MHNPKNTHTNNLAKESETTRNAKVPNVPTYETRPEPPKREPVLSYGIEVDPVLSLRNCEIGKSFVVDREIDRSRMFEAARHLGFKIRTVKEDDRIRVWRKS